MEFEFRFVVEGASVEDSNLVELLDQNYDAMLFCGGGLDLLDIAAEGDDAVTAAIDLARSLSRDFPRMKLLYLHRDLVGVPEIADRTRVTRQTVHLWINGSRRGEFSPFPAPEGVTGRTKVWLWSEVNEWLSQHGLGDDIRLPSRMEMADIDSALNYATHLGSSISFDRWLRTRKIGVVSCTYKVSSTSLATEEVVDYSTQGWAEVDTFDMAGVL